MQPTPVKPYVGWPACETEANSLLQALIEQAYEAQQKRLGSFLGESFGDVQSQ